MMMPNAAQKLHNLGDRFCGDVDQMSDQEVLDEDLILRMAIAHQNAKAKSRLALEWWQLDTAEKEDLLEAMKAAAKIRLVACGWAD